MSAAAAVGAAVQRSVHVSRAGENCQRSKLCLPRSFGQFLPNCPLNAAPVWAIQGKAIFRLRKRTAEPA